MRISLSMLFGLLVALGVFLAVQSLLVENQFRSATNQSFQGSGLVSFNNSTQNIQVRNSGKPQKPTAFNEPPLPPVDAFAAVKPPSIAAPSMVVPQVQLAFGVSAAPTPREQVASSSQPTSTGSSSKAGSVAPAKQKVLRAGNLVLVHRVAPRYPRRAFQRRIEGSVTLSFTVQPDGSVADPVVKTAKPRRGIFDEAAIRAVSQWKFKPIASATQSSVTLVFSRGGG